MGVRLLLELAPEFLAALLGVTQEDIERGFALVYAYEQGDMVAHTGMDTYGAMRDDPVASILLDYQRPFEYEGETYGGTLGFGKWASNLAWRIFRDEGLQVDPMGGVVKRTDDPEIVERIIHAISSENHRNLNSVVFADHCTGIGWD